jgi:polyphenol oxidase
MNISLQAHWKAYLFFPQVNHTEGASCPEFVGAYNFIPHVGQAEYNPKRVWRVAVGPKLKALGLDYVKSVIVTLVQPQSIWLHDIKFTKAKILYDTSG